jgi:hypothetical protein
VYHASSLINLIIQEPICLAWYQRVDPYPNLLHNFSSLPMGINVADGGPPPVLCRCLVKGISVGTSLPLSVRPRTSTRETPRLLVTLLLLVPRTLGARPPLLPRSVTWLPPTREVRSSLHPVRAAAAFDPHSDGDVDRPPPVYDDIHNAMLLQEAAAIINLHS